MNNKVILIHGFTATPLSFGKLPEILKQNGFQVITPELPGHCSKWEDMQNVKLEDWINCVKKKLIELKNNKNNIFLVGLSMGGILAAILAESFQNEIEAFTIISTPFTPKLHEKIALPFFKILKTKVKSIGGDIKKQGVIEKAYDFVPVSAVGELFKLMKIGKKALMKISLPSLAFYSKDDHIISKKNQILVKKYLKNTKIIILKNSYHVSTMDNDAPEMFKKIIEFFENYTD